MVKNGGGEDIVSESMGTISMGGESASSNAITVAKQMGIDLSGHMARHVTEDALEEFDKIIVMENNHRDAVLRMVPSCESKVSLLGSYVPYPMAGDEIPDPIGMDPMAFRTCFSTIIEAVQLFYKSILEEMEAR